MKAGLEDVVAGESGICYIDGDKGILAYRGYNIHELALNSTFEETCHLLWFGRLPKRDELEDTARKIKTYDREFQIRIRGFNVVDIWPRDPSTPFFTNEAYRQNQTLWKKAVRFVPEDELDW